jgi:hypothetical protein
VYARLLTTTEVEDAVEFHPMNRDLDSACNLVARKHFTVQFSYAKIGDNDISPSYILEEDGIRRHES